MLSNFLAEYQGVFPTLDAAQIAALEAHLELLEKWNRTINLTAIKNKAEAIRKHLGESLFLAAHLPAEPVRICDLGSGGGFPGIPAAIARPDCYVTLVESDIRKGVFLREATRKLPHVNVLTQRFEILTGEFDWLISRAVNLAKTSGGPSCPHAAFLGSVLETKPKTLSKTYQWTQVPLPWDKSSFLYLGERFT